MHTSKPASEELLDLLMEEGALDRPAAESVRVRLRDTWVPLGKILRQKGWLTMAQLVELLQLQARNSRLRIGEIALERGFCTLDQVEEALRIQRDLSPHVLDLLAEAQGVESVALLRAVSRYVRTLEKRLSEVRSEPV